MSPGRRVATGAAVLVLGLAAALTTSRAAAATILTPGSPHREKVIVLGSSAGVETTLVVDRLAPGSTVTQPFRLRLAGNVVAGRPAVAISHVRDFERGCNHPEAAAGDTSCGAGDDQGELAQQLLAGVTWQPAAACADTPRSVTGTVASLAGMTLSAGDRVEDESCLLLTLSLPTSADNLVQSDAVSFDLRIGLLDAVHRGDLRAAAALRGSSGGALTAADSALPTGTGGGGGVLPFTGLPLLPYLLLTVGLFLVGLGAAAAGNDHCRRTRS